MVLTVSVVPRALSQPLSLTEVLPPEIISKILSLLPVRDLVALSGVNKVLQTMANEDRYWFPFFLHTTLVVWPEKDCRKKFIKQYQSDLLLKRLQANPTLGDEDLNRLTHQFPQADSLRLSRCPRVTLMRTLGSSRFVSALTVLRIECCTAIPLHGLDGLMSRCRRLVHVHLISPESNKGGFITLNPQLSKKGIQMLVKQNRSLVSLTLDGLPLNNNIVACIARQARALRYLNLGRCESITQKAITALSRLPHLRSLYLSDSKNPQDFDFDTGFSALQNLRVDKAW